MFPRRVTGASRHLKYKKGIRNGKYSNIYLIKKKSDFLSSVTRLKPKQILPTVQNNVSFCRAQDEFPQYVPTNKLSPFIPKPYWFCVLVVLWFICPFPPANAYIRRVLVKLNKRSVWRMSFVQNKRESVNMKPKQFRTVSFIYVKTSRKKSPGAGGAMGPLNGEPCDGEANTYNAVHSFCKVLLLYIAFPKETLHTGHLKAI